MNPDDRIDEALRVVAQGEASRDFSARVHVRIEAGDDVRAAWWPKAAAGCAAVAVFAVTAMWLLRGPGVAPTPSVATARATPATVDSVTAPSARPEPTPLVTTARRPSARLVRAASSPRRAVSDGIVTDHERALTPLAAIDALDAGHIGPAALVMADQPIAALPPIPPLDVTRDIGGSDR